jgi:hypothetical protein
MAGAGSAEMQPDEACPSGNQPVAMLVSCFNEEEAIAKAVANFQSALPHAAIFVYDNNSIGRTFKVESRAGGPWSGWRFAKVKRHVFRRQLSNLGAAIDVLVDGDATYGASNVVAMINRLIEVRLAVAVIACIDQDRGCCYGHQAGNFTFLTSMFKSRISDICRGSGSFRSVSSFPPRDRFKSLRVRQKLNLRYMYSNSMEHRSNCRRPITPVWKDLYPGQSFS